MPNYSFSSMSAWLSWKRIVTAITVALLGYVCLMHLTAVVHIRDLFNVSGGVTLCALLLIAGLGSGRHAVRRWIGIGLFFFGCLGVIYGFRFQLSVPGAIHVWGQPLYAYFFALGMLLFLSGSSYVDRSLKATHCSKLLLCLVCGAAFSGCVVYYAVSSRPTEGDLEMLELLGRSEDEMVERMVADLTAGDRCDERIASAALAALHYLDREQPTIAKVGLARHIGYYYRMHFDSGDSNLVARIEEAATSNPEIAAELDAL